MSQRCFAVYVYLSSNRTILVLKFSNLVLNCVPRVGSNRTILVLKWRKEVERSRDIIVLIALY